MNAFTIDHNNSQITVTPLGKCLFKVEIPGKKLLLLLKQDNEGADHWFEDGTDNETTETRAIGTAIDNYMAKYDSLPMPDPYY
ncbi:hypothetical protein [Chitinophaga sp. CF418]|uniref:hypothetical protein n=1 Tax=Chitinophaga sp. CF418 TaxID=1855287 RepID=UPI0009180464|nr:hypothetical protein [Chitinophaga sp. CF418]SHN16720.1 hypothetical protein SAMN05216311_10693 [Chitinophaga sp. CF418]